MGDSIGEIAERDQNFSTVGMSVNVIEMITEQMTYYGPIVIFIFGFFGCFGNFLTFTSPRLRKNPCAFYFLCVTLFEFLSLSFGLTTRFAADHYGYDWHHRSFVFCKIRAYLVSSIPLICTYLLLLSSIDRYMSSSMIVARRTFSEIRLAHRLALFVIVLGLLSCSHILLTYDLRPKCSTLHGSYALFDGMFVVFWLGLIPHGLMISFAWMTLNNLRQRRIRIPSHRQQKIDQHLIVRDIFSASLETIDLSVFR